MFFGDFTVSPSTVYTYQIVYKTATGYAHPNYMYHYEYNGGTYVTEYGLWNSGRIQDLGNGWKHAWGTFTSNASTNRFICSLFHYEYATENRIEVAGVMLTQGNSIIPPPQFLSVNTTRSATQGLLDLTGNSSINLTNAAFNSSAQLTFDGTNTAVPITGLTVSAQQNKSYEAVIKLPTGYAQTGNIIGGRSNSTNVFLVDSERKLRGGEDDQFVIGSTQIQTGIWYHVAYTFEFDGATTSIQKLYINGVLDNQTTQTNYIDTYVESTQYLGYDWRFAYYFNGDITVCKVYNKTLTAAEVANNYNHYKGRFNI
jgi:hypothetical protein